MILRRLFLSLALLLAIASPAIAQNTLVSATITDAGGQAWVSGTYTFTSEAYPSIAIISGTLDATGSFTSVSFPTNNVTAGVGGRWRARICPAVTAPCYGISVTVPGGSTLSLTSALTPPAITIDALKPPPVTAYTDSEIINSVQGSRYFNVTDNTEHICKALPCSSNWQSVPNTGANNAFTGVNTFCTLHGWYVAGSSCYATILAAENAACALTPNGSVLIPATYAGTDLFRYDIGLCTRGFPAVIDLRRNALGIATVIAPVRPSFGSGQGGANATLPLGADLVLEADGAADMHFKLPAVVATTTATINIGANPSVLISAVTCPNCSTGLGITQTGANNFFTSASLILGRETANEENVIAGNWSIVDATHLSITATKSHSGTTDIEQQQGSFFFDGSSYVIFSPNNPAQLAGRSSPIRFFDPQLNVIYFMPTNTADPWPYGAMNFVAPLTGAANAIPLTPADLVLKNASAATSVVHRISTGTIDMTLADTGPVFNNTLTVTNAFTAATVNATGNIFANSGVVTGAGIRPPSAGSGDLGSTALPWANLWLGTAATNNFRFQPAATSQATVVSVLDPKAATSAISWQGGIPCTNGELALSAGWGTTATVTAVVGLGWSCEWTVTSSGTGQAANPTITDTLVLPVLSASIACEMRMVGGTGTATLIDQTTLSATAPVFTFGGTPVAASTYKVYRRC